MADDKTYGIEIDVSKVSSVNISRYADGYNYASISLKVSDKEYMYISYDWKGATIPEFALNAMDIMKSLGIEKAAVKEGSEKEYTAHVERAAKHFTDLVTQAKKKALKKIDKNICEDCGKTKDKCVCK